MVELNKVTKWCLTPSVDTFRICPRWVSGTTNGQFALLSLSGVHFGMMNGTSKVISGNTPEIRGIIAQTRGIPFEIRGIMLNVSVFIVIYGLIMQPKPVFTSYLTPIIL